MTLPIHHLKHMDSIVKGIVTFKSILFCQWVISARWPQASLSLTESPTSHHQQIRIPDENQNVCKVYWDTNSSYRNKNK
jgi:hypothetical protein